MKQIVKREFPVRRWSLEGFPETGKSTFATRMRGPLVVVDSDGRFEEVVHLVDKAFSASDDALGNVQILGIERGLATTVPKVKPATIVVDSVTEILNPVIAKMMMGDFEGNGQVIKAMLMRRLASAVCQFGTDVLFVYHLYEGRDNKGKETVSATLSEVEQDRLVRSLNVKLETVYDDGANRYGVKVLWARNRRCFPDVPLLWDDTRTWDGMPEVIEKAIYGGNGKPSTLSFKSVDEAIAWSVNTSHAYLDIETAHKFYDQVKLMAKPTSSGAMWEAWIAHCQAKAAEGSTE